MEILSIILSLVLIVLLLGLFVLIMYAMAFGAPFATVAQNRIDTMIKNLKLKKGQRMVDLGSGDGRIVISFARLGVEAHGYEINPVLVYLSRFKIKRAGLEKKAFIHFKDYWQEDLSKFDAVTLYGIGHMMGRLEKKLKKEFKGGMVASNYFRFPGLKPFKIENKVVFYRISN